MLACISLSMYKARGTFLGFSPCPSLALTRRLQKPIHILLRTISTIKMASKVIQDKPTTSEMVGNMIGKQVIKQIKKPINKLIKKGVTMGEETPLNIRHLMPGRRTRSWFTEHGQLDVVVIYHEGAKVGAHLDVHFSNGTSLIYRVRGKEELEKFVKFNRTGALTENAKKALLSHIEAEITKGARVPQNWDHDAEEARMSWYNGENDGPDSGYGSGPTRQIVLETKAEIIKTHPGNTKLYAPKLCKKSILYIYELQKGDDKKAPILIFGKKKNDVTMVGDKLVLKKMNEKQINKYKELIDPTSNTLKEDGAAMHIIQDNKGTRIFSHRISKTTGKKIEHTGKLPEIARLTSDTRIEGMFELTFFNKDGKLMTASESAGILNRDRVRDPDVTPRVAMYRIDKVGKEITIEEDFHTNRARQIEFAKQHSCMDVVQLVKDIVINRDIEGYVGVKPGMSLNSGGIKLKFKDANIYDWRIDTVELELGASSTEKSPKVAGYVWCTSTNSDKKFKLGPGQLGDRPFCLDIMNNPDKYIGRVLRVACLQEREGRSAKVDKDMPFHSDKGVE